MGLPPAARRIVRVIAWPVRRYFGTQFTWTRSQVVETDHRLHARLDQVSSSLDDLLGRRLGDAMAAMQREMEALRREVEDLRGAVEMSALAGSEALADVGNELRMIGEARAEQQPRHGPGHDAPAGPYVLRAIAPTRPGARVLVVGASGGPVAVALATLGYAVTAVGASANGAHHPDVVAGADRIEGWRPPREPFDAVVAVEAVDPLAQGVADAPGAAWMARESLERLRGVVREGGRLVLTSTVEPRTTTRADSVVPRLTEGWLLEDCTLAEQADEGTWRTLPSPRPPKVPGRRLLLVTARAVGE